MLLAQAPTTREAIEGLTEVTKAAAIAQPVIWLMIVLVMGLVVGVLIYVSRDRKAFLAYLEGQGKREQEKHDRLDTTVTKFIDRDRDAQMACHTHSLEMLREATKGQAAMGEAVHDLKATTTDVRAFVQRAMDSLNGGHGK